MPADQLELNGPLEPPRHVATLMDNLDEADEDQEVTTARFILKALVHEVERGGPSPSLELRNRQCRLAAQVSSFSRNANRSYCRALALSLNSERVMTAYDQARETCADTIYSKRITSIVGRTERCSALASR